MHSTRSPEIPLVIRRVETIVRTARATSFVALMVGAAIAGGIPAAIGGREPIALADLVHGAERVVEARVEKVHLVARQRNDTRMAVVELAIEHAFLGPNDEKHVFAIVPAKEADVAELLAPRFRELEGGERDASSMQTSSIWFLASPAQSLRDEFKATKAALQKLCGRDEPFEVMLGGRAHIPIDSRDGSSAWIDAAHVAIPKELAPKELAVVPNILWTRVPTSKLRTILESLVEADVDRIDAQLISNGPAPTELHIDRHGHLIRRTRLAPREIELDSNRLAAIWSRLRSDRFFEMPSELGRMRSPDDSTAILRARTRDGTHTVRIESDPPLNAKPGSAELAEYERANALWKSLPWTD